MSMPCLTATTSTVSRGVTRCRRAGQVQSKQHKISSHIPLQSQKILLTVTENKTQLIELICGQLIEKAEKLEIGDPHINTVCW